MKRDLPHTKLSSMSCEKIGILKDYFSPMKKGKVSLTACARKRAIIVHFSMKFANISQVTH